MENYELYHHGVKGQKWGVRRTPAQLGRGAKAKATAKKVASKAGKAVGNAAKKAVKSAKESAKQKRAEKREKKYYEQLKKKKLRDMTNTELKDYTARAKAEAAAKDAKYEAKMVNVRKVYNNVAKQPLNSFATTYATNLAKDMLGIDIKKVKDKEDKD